MHLSIWPSSPDALPAEAGTYVLLAALPRPRRLITGRLGLCAYPAGAWAYVGSAFGPGGLRARLRHHLGGPGRQHWHLDYLRPALQPRAIITAAGPERLEHAWACLLAAAPGSHTPVRGFGASDCHCDSHLFHLGTNLDIDHLAGILAR